MEHEQQLNDLRKRYARLEDENNQVRCCLTFMFTVLHLSP